MVECLPPAVLAIPEAPVGLAISAPGGGPVSEGTVSFANSPTVTFGMVGSTITASVLGGVALSAAGGAITSGTASFANSNGLSFGIAGQTVTGSFSTLSFANSNGITFGTAGSTLTAIVAGQTGTLFDNADNFGTYYSGANFNTALERVAPLVGWKERFPFDITASTFGLDVSLSGSTATMSVAFTSSVSVGIYTVTGASLSLLNSASATFGFAANGAGNSGSFAGERWLTFGTGDWSSLPVFTRGGDYYLGVACRTSGALVQTSSLLGYFRYSSGQRSGTVGGGAAVATSVGVMPFIGVWQTASSLAASIANSDLRKTGQADGFIPHVFMNLNTNVVSF